jgi:hypothetical protein
MTSNTECSSTSIGSREASIEEATSKERTHLSSGSMNHYSTFIEKRSIHRKGWKVI